MSEAVLTPAGHAVPTVAFYGDTAEWSTSALLHSEPLIERSRLHAWRIRPHRHSRLAQVFWVSQGSGRGRFDGEAVRIEAPCAVIVPELCVHEFDWAEGCEGFALSVASVLIHDLSRQIGASAKLFATPAALDAATDAAYVDTLFSRIHDEYVGHRPLKESLLESLVKALAIWVLRAGGSPLRRPDPQVGVRGAARPEEAGARHVHYRRFTQLLERHHRSGWAVADYARALGLSAAHLNTVCRQASGQTALRLIHERVLLAARRELAYTDKSIATIAAGLGFAEPSYFTRFFKRQMGMTPKVYRRESGTLAG